MRVAILADIHGNLRALEAVRRDLAFRSPDVVLNLGDHVSGPLDAAATADLLMAEQYVTIRGNHDRQLIDRPLERMGPSDRAAHAQLNSRQLEWLAGLPSTMVVEDMLLCHGSPSDDLQYLMEEVVGDRTQLAPAERISALLGGSKARVVLCGHTHIPRMVALGDGTLGDGTVVVNPGSVGLPAFDDTWTRLHYVETGSPHARYALLDWSPKTVRVEFIAIEYDWASAAAQAAAGNRPDWAHALATGYALRSA